MRLVSFTDREPVTVAPAPRLGLMTALGVVDLSAALPDCRGDMRLLLPQLAARREAIDAAGRSEPALAPAAIRLLAPVPRPGKILAIGRNYRDHAKEMGGEPPKAQTWFNKQANAAHGPFEPVEKPDASEQLDYEGELVVIIGRFCRNVPEARASEVVAGYCVGCDFSVRDWQRAAPTMIAGKGFPTHAPFGPALVSQDEIADIGSLRIETWVNGDQRQSALAADMIHAIPAQIALLSTVFALEPGDVIFTGTPAGVAAGRDPPLWLKTGDVVEVAIEPLGRLRHEIVPAPSEPIL